MEWDFIKKKFTKFNMDSMFIPWTQDLLKNQFKKICILHVLTKITNTVINCI